MLRCERVLGQLCVCVCTYYSIIIIIIMYRYTFIVILLLLFINLRGRIRPARCQPSPILGINRWGSRFKRRYFVILRTACLVGTLHADVCYTAASERSRLDSQRGKCGIFFMHTFFQERELNIILLKVQIDRTVRSDNRQQPLVTAAAWSSQDTIFRWMVL